MRAHTLPRPALLICLAISAMLHVLLVLTVPGPPRDLSVRVFRMEQRRLDDLLIFQPPPPDLPDRAADRLGSPEAGHRRPSAIVAIPYEFLSAPGVPLSASGDSVYEVGTPHWSPPEAIVDLDLNTLELEALRRRLAERDSHTRLSLLEADTTDAESRNRRRARSVVERAIEAMGGMDALLAIVEMRVHVWVLSREHVIPGVGRAPTTYLTVPAYVYPVTQLRYRGVADLTEERVKVEVSLDPGVANPVYADRNPARELNRYDLLFRNIWGVVMWRMPAELRDRREAGRAERWHFLDRYLGSGVQLTYLGDELLRQRPVEVIRVDDSEFGNYMEALFDVHTGLLAATREGLSPGEQQLYRRTRLREGRSGVNQRVPPVWETLYGDYRDVQGVLTAHRLHRGFGHTGQTTLKLAVCLQVAYNGAEPDDTPPAVP